VGGEEYRQGFSKAADRFAQHSILEMNETAAVISHGNKSTRDGGIHHLSIFCQVPVSLSAGVYFSQQELSCWSLVLDEIYESLKNQQPPNGC